MNAMKKTKDKLASVLYGIHDFMQKPKVQLVIKIMLTVAVVIFYAYFITHKEFYMNFPIGKDPELLKKKLLMVTGGCFVVICCIFIKVKFSKKWNLFLSILAMEATPFVCFIALETTNPGLRVYSITAIKIFLNLIIYALILGAAFVITANVKASIITTCVVTGVFGLANYFVNTFRGIPLLASDFTVMRTAMNVAAEYDYSISRECMYMIVYLVTFCALVLKINPLFKIRKRYRFTMLALYVMFVIPFFNFTMNEDRMLHQYGIKVNTFRPIRSYWKNGSMLTLYSSIRYIIVKKPEGYSVEKVKKIGKKYTSDEGSKTATVTTKTPNIIVVMDEAYSDLTVDGKFKTNKAIMPNYDSMKENVMKGYASVSIFASQTSNSEYEFLTGNSKAFLPEQVTPYQLYIKDNIPSLTSTLRSSGYGTLLAMHPYIGTGYNRENVYRFMGFDKFITQDDFENPKYVRKYISDESNVDKIIEEYEKSRSAGEKTPFYMMNVTMQNHSSYTEPFDNMPTDLKITDGNREDTAERYLNLVHLTDEQIGRLVEYFKKQEEPTMIFFFGDHQPGISNLFYEKIMQKPESSLTSEELMKKYKVPYFVWTNYSMKTKLNHNTSLNYLLAEAMENSGMKMTAYQKYLLDLKKQVPIINGIGYYGADGKFYENEDTTSPYYKTLKEYEMLEYHQVFDKYKDMKEFYYLK